MQDVGIFYSNGIFQLNLENGDLKGDEGIETAVVISLFTDKRVPQDEIPQGLNTRRGWWGDMFPDVEGDQIGSKLWTLERSKLTLATLATVETEAKNALAWMIQDSLAKSISVSASRDELNRLILEISITKPNEEKNRFGFLWDGQDVKRLAA